MEILGTELSLVGFQAGIFKPLKVNSLKSEQSRFNVFTQGGM